MNPHLMIRNVMNPKDQILDAMAAEIGAAMRTRMTDYFAAAGTHDPAAFLGDMAKPLVRTLRSLAIEALRDESGSHLPPGEIDSLVASALTTGALLTRGVKEPR